MFFYCPKEVGVLTSAADFASTLGILQKYATETRSMVDDFLETADFSTKLAINRDILANYHRAILRYQPSSECEDVLSIDSDFIEVKSEKEVKIKNEVNFESALPTIHEVRVLQIQMEHILPILQNEKVTGASSRVNIKNEVLLKDENTTRIPSDQTNGIKIPTVEIKEKNLETADVKQDEDVKPKERQEKGKEMNILEDNCTNNPDEDIKNDDHVRGKELEKKETKMHTLEEQCSDNVSAVIKNISSIMMEAGEKRERLNAKMKRIMKLIFYCDMSIEKCISELRRRNFGEQIKQCLSYTRIKDNIKTIFIENHTSGTIIHMTDHVEDISPHYIHTPKFVIQNTSWHFFYSHNNDALSMFLKCDDVPSRIANVTARAYLIVVSQNPEVENFVLTCTHTFSSLQYDWGFSEMIHWDMLMDPVKGYVKNNRIILQAIIHLQNS